MSEYYGKWHLDCTTTDHEFYWCRLNTITMLELHLKDEIWEGYTKELFNTIRDFRGFYGKSLDEAKENFFHDEQELLRDYAVQNQIEGIEDTLNHLVKEYPDFVITWDIQYKKK